MSEHDYNKILAELQVDKEGLRTLERKIEKVEDSIKGEMKLKHQAIEFKHLDHDRRLSFNEKIVFTTTGFILLGFLGAILNLVVN